MFTFNFYKNSQRHLRAIKSNGKYFCSSAPSMKIKNKIGFIGDGSMAKAICQSIERKGLITYSQVYVSSPYLKNLDAWKQKGANVFTDNNEVAFQSEIIFLAVKPHILAGLMKKMVETPNSKNITNKLFISILAGITLDVLEKMITNFQNSRMVRVMCNTPMQVGAGCSVYCPGKNVSTEDINLVETIFTAAGICKQVPENLINPVCAVSASGTAFVYLFIEALSDGGVNMGLHRETATKFAAQTVMGAAKIVLETGKHMGTLKDEVCSAGGTTIAGLHAMEKGAVRGAVMSAVESATNRALKLGN